jgi:hypothetical protein
MRRADTGVRPETVTSVSLLLKGIPCTSGARKDMGQD